VDVQSKRIEEVFNGGGVGTCAGQRIILGAFVQDPRHTQDVIPSHKTTVGTQRVVRSSNGGICRIPHSAFRIPHSAFRIPHSAFRIPHSAFRIPHSAFRISPHRR
jgi:hypothetical protein